VKRLLALLLLAVQSCATVRAAPKDAVVRVYVQLPGIRPDGGQMIAGGSATVIYTAPGRTLLLGCAHLYEEAMPNAKMEIKAPTPTQPGSDPRRGSRLIAIDKNLDLSLVEMSVGPLPYWCQVAPRGTQPGVCFSVGFDNGKMPPQVRTANIIGTDPWGRTVTREPPWHGRSGGALIDQRTGYLVGVVHGYDQASPDSPPRNGLYVSHQAVLSFLARNGIRDFAPVSPQIVQRRAPRVIDDEDIREQQQRPIRGLPSQPQQFMMPSPRSVRPPPGNC
jgi:hypothetical protein